MTDKKINIMKKPHASNHSDNKTEEKKVQKVRVWFTQSSLRDESALESDMESGNVAVKSDIGKKFIVAQMLVHLWCSMKSLNPLIPWSPRPENVLA